MSMALTKYRLSCWDLSLCLSLHRLSQYPASLAFFAWISRLGNGLFWYTLMLLLALFEPEYGQYVVLQMAIVGMLGVLIYLPLKRRFIRQRPCQRFPVLKTRVAPLDLGSFPSGHTLHAVGFSLIASLHYPVLAELLICFSILTAAGRVILGLHYPSDVLAGAVIGLVNALVIYCCV